MDEKVIVAFAKWMQTKDEQLAQVPTEQLAEQVIKALQTEEGQKQLQPLFQQFQTEMQGGMFKCGGKMDQAVKKMKRGSKTEKVEAPSDEIQYANDPRLKDVFRKEGSARYDGIIYYKHDGF
jgi:Skp family chaperone for outer membrane proteins